ncbi:MAG: hypothetical protein E7275_03985 [Pseudobutyrivibrio sp.]|uniref:hypothetical protein n=1 Tax=unclassified Pseudobutyrivibrio TaxID=2638619 RepID=UPI000890DFF2|nr:MULTISPECIES: hypothetical protein [unclassified Pseudobutyrivibrio]MBE5903428.1 hypothetical protein [Pseudobutyrivibrio sp.]SCY31730.1 hypothetical protein SAMN05660668_02161 [Pseudobutyrivibrio sp. AR14]
MAFIGVLLVCLLMLAAFLAVVGLVLFLIAVGVTAIISSVVLANTGKKLSESKRKKTLVIVLLIAAVLALVPSGFLIYKFVVLFLLSA